MKSRKEGNKPPQLPLPRLIASKCWAKVKAPTVVKQCYQIKRGTLPGASSSATGSCSSRRVARLPVNYIRTMKMTNVPRAQT